MFKVPTILQMETVECGAACLAMILAYHGTYISLEELRVDCGVSRDGVKANNITKAAKYYGLIGKGYRMEPEALKKIQKPMIIHWNFNHFLIVEGFKKGYAYLNDPGGGRRRVSEEEFDQSFTGVVLLFEPSEEFEKQGQKPSVLRSIIKRIKGSEGALGYIFLTGLALALIGFVVPTFSRILIDDILLKNNYDWLGMLLVGMFVTACLRALLTALQNLFLLRLENKISISSSSNFFWHVLRLPIVFFSQRYTGDISSRIESNDKMARVLSGQLVAAVLNALLVLLLLILMVQYDIGLTIVGIIAVIFNLIFLHRISVKRVNLNNKLLQDRSKVHSLAMSGLKMIETLKATGAESDFFSKWAGYQTKVLTGEQEMQGYDRQLMLIPSFISTITNAVVLIVGTYKIFEGQMTIGMLVAFQSLMSSFLGPVNVLVNSGKIIQELQGDLNRLDDVLKYPLDAQISLDVYLDDQQLESESLNNVCKLVGEVEMKNITFGYSRLEAPLIDDFNLHITPGSRVALVGGSGSGKSTIVKLLTGVHHQWSGEILLDGKPRENIKRDIITNSLAVVEQEITIFEGTMRDNLTLWDTSVPEIDLICAAKDACIHGDIVSRVGGYDYMLKEGGTNFSGGQRQRTEIARALIPNPSILIMDEATSALDPTTELRVDKNIRRRGCTCLIVAHRLSTIRDCDEIIVMEGGKIVERGTHDQMKFANGPYASLIGTKHPVGRSGGENID